MIIKSDEGIRLLEVGEEWILKREGSQKTGFTVRPSNGEEPTGRLRRRTLSLVDRNEIIAESRRPERDLSRSTETIDRKK